MNIYDLQNQFLNEKNIFENEDLFLKIQSIIKNKINDTEKRIFVIYCETGSLRKAEKYFKKKINYQQIRIVINKVKKIILENINTNEPNNK
jgi:hypothetical protein